MAGNRTSRKIASSRCAFTLIELLMVVTVIAILTAMAMPSFVLVRDSARTLKCKGNLRQIVIGVYGYAQDWHGKIVPQYISSTRWFSSLGPYLDANRKNSATWAIEGDLTKFNSVFWGCPVYNIDMHKKGTANYDWRPGYGLAKKPGLPAIIDETNWAPPWPSYTRDISLVELSNPGQRLLMTETRDWYTEASWSGTTAIWWDPEGAFSRGDIHRHRGKANYGFLDGHAATLGPERTALAYLDPAQYSP